MSYAALMEANGKNHCQPSTPYKIVILTGSAQSEYSIFSEQFWIVMLSSAQLRECQEAFALFDFNGDGSIDTVHLGFILRWLGQNPTELELQNTIYTMHAAGHTSLSFPDFLHIVISEMENLVSEERLIDAFKVFDKKGDGFISTSELRHILTNLGERLSDDEVDLVVKDAIVHEGGQIYYSDFVKVLMCN